MSVGKGLLFLPLCVGPLAPGMGSFTYFSLPITALLHAIAEVSTLAVCYNRLEFYKSPMPREHPPSNKLESLGWDTGIISSFISVYQVILICNQCSRRVTV